MIDSAQHLRISHEERNQKLTGLLKRTKKWYESDNENSEAQGNASALSKLIDDVKSGEYSIVVVGEFSTGKSTILNALMQKNVLPALVRETTATVNFLRHSERSNGKLGCVYFTDGTTCDIPDISVKTIERYVSTKGDNVAETVDHLDLYFDSPFLKDGVTLVDSPGLGGLAKGHMEITKQQMLKSHAAIFVFSAEKGGGSASEFQKLSDLKSKVGTILIVINKIDYIHNEGETVEDIVEATIENYRKVFPDQDLPEIWPVAALPALAAREEKGVRYNDRTEHNAEQRKKMLEISRLEAFEARLLEFLTKGEKTKGMMIEPITRVENFVKNTKDYLENEISMISSKADASDVEEQIVNINDAVTGLERQISESERTIREDLRIAFEETVEEQSADFDKFSKRFLSGIDDCDSLDAIIDYIGSLNDSVKQFGERIGVQAEEHLQSKIAGIIHSSYSRSANDISDKIENAGSFGIKLNLSSKFIVDESSFNVGLDKMADEERILMAELREIQEKVELAEMDKLKARKVERDRAKLELQLEAVKNRKMTVNDRILPQIRTDYIQTDRSKSFGERGLLGSVWGALFGAKRVHETNRVIDTTERDEATKRRDTELSALRNEEAKLLQQYEVKQDSLSTDEAGLAYAKFQRELDAKRDEITSKSKENRALVHEKFNKQITKQRREVRDSLEDLSYEFGRSLKKEMDKQKQTYIDIIKDVVIGNLSSSLINEKEKLRLLQSRLQDSEVKKIERLAVLNTRVSEADTILLEAVNLEYEFRNLAVSTKEELRP